MEKNFIFAIAALIGLMFLCIELQQSLLMIDIDYIPIEKDTLVFDGDAGSSMDTNEDVIWKGKTSEVEVEWSAADLIYSRNGKSERVFSVLSDQGKKSQCLYMLTYQDDCECAKPSRGACFTSFEYRLISVFGAYITFEEIYTGCGGTMLCGEERRYTTIDTGKRKAPIYSVGGHEGLLHVPKNQNDFVVSLDDLFDEQKILVELLKHDVVSKGLISEGIDIKRLNVVSDLEELEGLNGRIRLHGYTHEVPRDLLTRFAIADIKDDKVVVRVSIPPRKGGYLKKDLSIVLSPSAGLRTILDSAKAKKEGFLMNNAQSMFGDKNTKITL